MKPVPWFDGLKRWHFALATLLLFGIEVLIARYTPPGFIRGFIGDLLVVILMFCALKTVSPWASRLLLPLVLAFAFAIEFGQAFGLVDKLGLGHIRLARIVIGSHFDWLDLLAYSLGCLLLLPGSIALSFPGRAKIKGPGDNPQNEDRSRRSASG